MAAKREDVLKKCHFLLLSYLHTKKKKILLLLFPDLTRPSIMFAQLVGRLGIILGLKGKTPSKAMSTNSHVIFGVAIFDFLFFIQLTVVNLKHIRAKNGAFFFHRKCRTCRTSQGESDCLSRSEASF